MAARAAMAVLAVLYKRSLHIHRGDMKILHNQFDIVSKQFVDDMLETGRTDIEVVNWYNPDDLQAWIDNGGTLKVCAFPTVIIGDAMLVMPSVEDVLAEVNHV